MRIFKTVNEMRGWSKNCRHAGESVAFVPTMGALHEGHLKLVDCAREQADRVVLSIYVNPTQFGPDEDLDKYPKMLKADLEKAHKRDVDIVFVPDNDQMYPEGSETFVDVEYSNKHLCGLKRPTHFRGVATVVAKLFNAVIPDVAVFGEKDYQQLIIIRKMVRDLIMPVQVLGYPIVRESDGLAMSSRNKYLSVAERKAALSLSESLTLAQSLIDEGELSATKISSAVKKMIGSNKLARVDYVSICDSETLEPMKGKLKGKALLAIAAHIGKARLIDNCILNAH